MNSEERTIIYTSRSKNLKVLRLVTILIGIILIPAYLILGGLIHLPGIITFFSLFVSFFGFIFFTPYWLSCLYRSFVRLPAVSLSREGIYEASWFLGAGLIKWSELSGFSVDNNGSNRWLLIISHDPQPIWNRMSILKRLGSKANSIFARSPFLIPEYLIEGSIDDLVLKIQEYSEANVKTISKESPSTQDGLGLTSIGGDSLTRRICPQCHDAKVSRPVNKTILLVSIVVFVVADVLYSIGGYIESLAYRCRNCGFVWKQKN